MTVSVLRFTETDAGVHISAEQFAHAVLSPPFIYERVKGRLVVMSPAGRQHRECSRPFRRELGLYWGLHPTLVDDVDIEGWVATSEDDDRIPDICVYLAGESSDQAVPQRVPDIIFEFVSAERSDQERDYIDKRREYYHIGVREYVIVDRFKRAILILTRQQSEDYAERWINEGDYTTPLLPGLNVALAEVFQD